MQKPILILSERAAAFRAVIRSAALGLIMLPLSAMAEMETVSQNELSTLEAVDNSGYAEFYQHPDLGTFQFKDIYIEPARNEMSERLIREYRYRRDNIDELTADFHKALVDAFEATGLLTDTPDENTLVISPALTFVTEYDERTTGSRLGGARVGDRERGHTIMEMTWRAGPNGPIVAAIRDGRTPYVTAPVTDRDDKFTDAHDTFDIWAMELASFFGAVPENEMN